MAVHPWSPFKSLQCFGNWIRDLFSDVQVCLSQEWNVHFMKWEITSDHTHSVISELWLGLFSPRPCAHIHTPLLKNQMMTDIPKSFKHSFTAKSRGRFSELRRLIISNTLMKKMDYYSMCIPCQREIAKSLCHLNTFKRRNCWCKHIKAIFTSQGDEKSFPQFS